MSTIVRFAVLILVLVSLPLSVWQGWVHQRADALAVLRALRVRTFLLAIPLLALTVAVGVALIHLPVLRLGWWSLLDHGAAQGPISSLSTSTAWVALPFLALLVMALPRLVLSEERMYREGAEDRSTRRNIARALRFGLAHSLWLGIPIGFGLALSIGGWWFTRRYLTAYHAEYRAAAMRARQEIERAFLGQIVIGNPPVRIGKVQAIAVRHAASAHLAWNLSIVLLVLLGTLASMAYR